jgi:hypothetical protein
MTCKTFPAHPRTEGPHAVAWTGIRPAVVRSTASNAVSNQTIYLNYGKLKRKFRNSAFNPLPSSNVDGTNGVTHLVSKAERHKFIYI